MLVVVAGRLAALIGQDSHRPSVASPVLVEGGRVNDGPTLSCASLVVASMPRRTLLMAATVVWWSPRVVRVTQAAVLAPSTVVQATAVVQAERARATRLF